MLADDVIKVQVTARYREYQDIAVGAFIGSRAKGCADNASDYDLMILWEKLPAFLGKHLYIEEFFMNGIETQAVHFDMIWLEKLLSFFSRGGDISGDWGELGYEAFLAFVSEAKMIWGDAQKLASIQGALIYTDTFQNKAIADQLLRVTNSVVQWKKRKGRSYMLALKSYYDFMDGALRIVYAKNRRFYSTIKWFEYDINTFPVPSDLKSNLQKMAYDQSAFALYCFPTYELIKAYCDVRIPELMLR